MTPSGNHDGAESPWAVPYARDGGLIQSILLAAAIQKPSPPSGDVSSELAWIACWGCMAWELRATVWRISSMRVRTAVSRRLSRAPRTGSSRSKAGAVRAPGTDATSTRARVECRCAPSAGDECGRCAHAPAITASDGRVQGRSTGTSVRIGETSRRAVDRQCLHRLGGHVQQSEI